MDNKNKITFYLDGNEEDLQILADLQAEGKLEGLLNELKVSDLPPIKVIKAEFTEDEEVIKKCELIDNIRKGNASKQDLKGVDLSGANLRGVNFAGCDLSNANFKNADLREVNFTDAILNDANLNGADLSFSNLEGASCFNTDFTDTNLSGVTPYCG